MKISQTPTNLLIVKANTNAEYGSVDIALIRLDNQMFTDIQKRLSAAALFGGDGSFCNLSFWDSRVEFKDWNENNLTNKHEELMKEINDDDLDVFIELEEGDNLDEIFVSIDVVMEAHMMQIDNNGCFSFSCSAKYDGAEYWTEGIASFL